MNWLTITILAYLILAVVALVDKYLLVSAIPNPKVYAFLIGFAGILVLLLAPFIGFYIPDKNQIIISLLSGASFVYGLYLFFKGLQFSDVSQIVPAIGAMTPLFTFGLVFIFSSGQEKLSSFQAISFILLILGTALITLEKGKSITLKSISLSLTAAFLFSLSLVLSKYVYLEQPFLNGLIWTRLGGVLMALLFLILCPEVKKEIFHQKNNLQKKTGVILLAGQGAAAFAGLLQNWAVALAPLALIAFINALQGIQYVFLLLLSVFLSSKFPGLLKEYVSGKVIIQRVIAILFIGAGLVLLAL